MDMITEREIGQGDDAIKLTVAEMQRIIDVSSKNPYVREWARYILDGVAVNDKYNEAVSMHNFVRDNIRYTRDPHGWEYVQTPPLLLAAIKEYLAGRAPRPIGDCDDMTTLVLSLMRSVGFPVMIKVVGYGQYFSHVYGLVNIKNKWYVTDTVRPDRSFNWEAGNVTRILEVFA
jgi:transglutaminase-like putative cysteine protease